jgi:hypothetical protein
MMVATVMEERPACIRDSLLLQQRRSFGICGKVKFVGHLEAEQVSVEVDARFHIHDVEAKVAESTDFEWPIQLDSADIVGALFGCHGASLIYKSRMRFSISSTAGKSSSSSL